LAALVTALASSDSLWMGSGAGADVGAGAAVVWLEEVGGLEAVRMKLEVVEVTLLLSASL